MHRWERTSWCSPCSTHVRAFITVRTSRREFKVIGVILLTLTLLLSFTGYLRHGDQLAIVAVGTNMMQYTGVWTRGEIRGRWRGNRIRNPVRWYVLHVLFFPFIIVIFMAIHFGVSARTAASVDRSDRRLNPRLRFQNTY